LIRLREAEGSLPFTTGPGSRVSHSELLAELPEGCDPCGENGEMHTIAVAGPMFQRPIAVSVGETLERDGFAYADIVPRPVEDQT
jgi:diphthamide synthase (EF-2-diphthine--ammonia ligase)